MTLPNSAQPDQRAAVEASTKGVLANLKDVVIGTPDAADRAVGFAWPVRIYWEDTDAGGIVFYANYLKFFERARTEWLRSLGIDQQTQRETVGGMFVVTDAQLRYLRPAKLDDLLRVTASVSEAGRASLTIKQQAWLQVPGGEEASATLLCEGSVRIGWVNGTDMRPMRIPADLLNLLQPTQPEP